MSSGMWFVFLPLVVYTFPVLLGLILFSNRDTGESTDEQIEELEQRVEELKEKQD